MKSSSLLKKKTAQAARKGGTKELSDFVAARDYTGALALLDFKLKCQDGDTADLLKWIGYCAFHLGKIHSL
jgi:hypothetical protein